MPNCRGRVANVIPCSLRRNCESGLRVPSVVCEQRGKAEKQSRDHRGAYQGATTTLTIVTNAPRFMTTLHLGRRQQAELFFRACQFNRERFQIITALLQ